ncbi:hypothetical protein T11_12478, partial [Trichinella zimbabwensis]
LEDPRIQARTTMLSPTSLLFSYSEQCFDHGELNTDGQV